MPKLQDVKAKICLTAAGVLVHQGRVLLVKHKKLGYWLNPGGHIEADELPHHAAEREFWEETGVKVRAVSSDGLPNLAGDISEFMPLPITANLHWVSEKNYEQRLQDPGHYHTEKKWKRGCEQHCNFVYLVEPVGSLELKQNDEESDGIEWFTLAQVKKLDMPVNIVYEIERAFAAKK